MSCNMTMPKAKVHRHENGNTRCRQSVDCDMRPVATVEIHNCVYSISVGEVSDSEIRCADIVWCYDWKGTDSGNVGRPTSSSNKMLTAHMTKRRRIAPPPCLMPRCLLAPEANADSGVGTVEAIVVGHPCIYSAVHRTKKHISSVAYAYFSIRKLIR